MFSLPHDGCTKHVTLAPLGASDAHLVPPCFSCEQQTAVCNPDTESVLISREVVDLNGMPGIPS